MDVTKLQKINQLAKELKQHGMAESMDEAAVLAERMVEKKETGLKEEVEENTTKAEDDDLGLQLRRLNTRFSDQSRVIEELKNKMEVLMKEVDILKKAKPPEPQPVSAQPQVPPTGAVEIKTSPVKKQDKEEGQTVFKEQADNPRSGDYKSGDVSIEKIFYSGSKPKSEE